MLSKQCKLQLENENKTPAQHFKDAVQTAVIMQIMVPAVLLHSVAPRCFAKTSEKIINKILDKENQ